MSYTNYIQNILSHINLPSSQYTIVNMFTSRPNSYVQMFLKIFGWPLQSHNKNLLNVYNILNGVLFDLLGTDTFSEA